jgi:hypothetical protein
MNAPQLRRRLTPYAQILPGGLWLAIFFIVPIVPSRFPDSIWDK